MGKLLVTQTKSSIATKPKHRGTLRALGLRGVGKSNELPDRPEIHGMVKKVSHLVEVKALPGIYVQKYPPKRTQKKDIESGTSGIPTSNLDSPMNRIGERPFEYRYGEQDEYRGTLFQPSLNEWIKFEPVGSAVAINWTTWIASGRQALEYLSGAISDASGWEVAISFKNGEREQGNLAKKRAGVLQDTHVASYERSISEIALLQIFNENDAFQWREALNAYQLGWMGDLGTASTILKLISDTATGRILNLRQELSDFISSNQF
jgi:large subunit ribosomal protein L30